MIYETIYNEIVHPTVGAIEFVGFQRRFLAFKGRSRSDCSRVTSGLQSGFWGYPSVTQCPK